MRKPLAVLGICLMTLPAFSQSAPKYQVATILEVKPHQVADVAAPKTISYDVSVKVGETIYVAQYTPRMEEGDARHAAGRDLLVLVNNNTITYVDIMGRSYDVSIVSKRPVQQPK